MAYNVGDCGQAGIGYNITRSIFYKADKRAGADNAKYFGRDFKDPQVKYGLREFSKLKIEEVITVFEKEKDKFYIHCLKRDKDIAFNSTRNIRNSKIDKLT